LEQLYYVTSQESHAENAAEKPKVMVRTSTLIVCDDQRKGISLKELVPGDIMKTWFYHKFGD
jgi:magnesium-transporting ATPase (P-type)